VNENPSENEGKIVQCGSYLFKIKEGRRIWLQVPPEKYLRENKEN
jgi:hypothetical protein